MAAPPRITEVLADLRNGNESAREELYRAVYEDLHAMAAARIADQSRRVTIQATVLVNETLLRLLGPAETAWEDRRHFFGVAARAMRSILVDVARRRAAQKRGGGVTLLSLSDEEVAAKDGAMDVVFVHDALARLSEIDPGASEVVELRFFGGLSVAEVARALDVSERTVYRTWEAARVWLYREFTR